VPYSYLQMDIHKMRTVRIRLPTFQTAQSLVIHWSLRSSSTCQALSSRHTRLLVDNFPAQVRIPRFSRSHIHLEVVHNRRVVSCSQILVGKSNEDSNTIGDDGLSRLECPGVVS